MKKKECICLLSSAFDFDTLFYCSLIGFMWVSVCILSLLIQTRMNSLLTWQGFLSCVGKNVYKKVITIRFCMIVRILIYLGPYLACPFEFPKRTIKKIKFTFNRYFKFIRYCRFLCKLYCLVLRQMMFFWSILKLSASIITSYGPWIFYKWYTSYIIVY